MGNSTRGPFISVSLALILSIGAIVWVLQRRWQRQHSAIGDSQAINRPTPSLDTHSSPVAPPSPILSPEPSPVFSSPAASAQNADASQAQPANESPSQTLLQLDPSYVGKLNLIIPVAGVKPNQLKDTFDEARSEGRVHDAIDIPALPGTPVLAAADGEIIKLFESDRGGTTIYQLSIDKKLIYYYAHLQRYADGVVPGKLVRQGEVIAYVGDTGNAGPGNYHLHFSIAIVSDPKRYWEGRSINPYPLLHK